MSLWWYKMIDKSLLTFDNESHTYYYDNKKVFGVTSTLKPLSDKIYKNINQDVMDVAAKRGTQIHFAVELYNEYGAIEIAEENKGYLEAYIKFKKEWNHEPIRNEYRVYSELGYAGTVDNVGNINNQLTVVDYKTTSSLHKDLVGLQLSAYRNALLDEGLEVNQAICLQLKKNGKCKPIFYNQEQLDTYFEHFKTYLQSKKLTRYYLGGE